VADRAAVAPHPPRLRRGPGRLARTAGIGAWDQLSPHSLRHSAITFALDAGAALRDVQDYAGHKDPRTTRRYDHSRDSLDRSVAYTVAAYLALWPCWSAQPGRRQRAACPPLIGRRLGPVRRQLSG
jgi:Phage integrase family